MLECGREVDAADLSYGSLRSNTYTCLCCKNAVSYVTGSERAKPHFRHKHDESCISHLSYKQIEEQAEARISNRKSTFHTWWQLLFDKNNIEVRVSEGNKVQIADVYLNSERPFIIRTDTGENLFTRSTNNLIIEVQHSTITSNDAKQRDVFYNTENRQLLWIFNIAHIPHTIDRFITVTQDKMRILFTKQQHSGLVNVAKHCNKSTILLDVGNYLFKIKDVCFDNGFTHVVPLSKKSFIEQLQAHNVTVNLDKYINTNEKYTFSERNYKTFIDALDIRYQVDVDEILNMIEDIPISCLREGCQLYTHNEYNSYIEMVARWLGNVSNSNPLVYKLLQQWISFIRKTYYSNDFLTFGKHKYEPICNLPQAYLKWILEERIIKDEDLDAKLLELRSMDQWFLNHYFKNPGKLVHLKRCRDSYYRHKWDKRDTYQRKKILESICKRPWISMIEEVNPSDDGYVYSTYYLEDVNLPTDSCEIFQEQNTNGSKDDDLYIYKYKPAYINEKYIGINEEDLLWSYGFLDDYYKYNYKTRSLNSDKKMKSKNAKLKGYAFIDEEFT